MPIEERREQVLDAALRLISDHGYRAASMEGIAREAGIAKPVVYEAFPGRGALLRALLEREEARAWGALAEALASPTPDATPDQLLIEGAERFLRAVTANATAWKLILLPTDETPSEVRAHVEAGRRTVLAQLRDLLDWGLPQRRGLEDIDHELAAQSLLAIGEQAARLILTDPDAHPPERWSKFAAQLFGALDRA